MACLAKLRDQLDVLGRQLEEASQRWSCHMDDVRNEWTAFETQHPSTLKRNAWATQRSCSPALYRLEALTAILQKRVDTLRAYGVRLHNRPTVGQLVARNMRKPVGTETQTWRVICAIIEAEDTRDGERLVIDSIESDVSGNLKALATMHHGISKCARSEAVDSMSTLAECAETLMLSIEARLEALVEGGGSEMEFWLLDNELDLMMMDMDKHHKMFLREGHGTVQRGILVLMAHMARTGIKLARQTLITEYFKPVPGQPNPL